MKKYIIGIIVSIVSTQNSFAAPATGPSWVSAWWTFATYFQNLVDNPCGSDDIMIGLKSWSDYAKPDCLSVGKVLGAYLGTFTAPTDGQALSWFDPSTGEPVYVDAWSDLPVGSVIAFNLNACPTGWMAANGANGTIDLRGEFIRGWDNGRWLDTGRTLGSTQKWTIKAYDTDSTSATYAQDIWWDGTATANDFGLDRANIWADYNAPILRQTYLNASYQGLTWFNYWVMRPRNVALLYCMKLSGSSSSVSNATTWTRAGDDVLQASPWNVGIGTNAPGAKLDVAGDMRVSNGLTVNGSQNNVGPITASTTIRANGGLISSSAGWAYSYLTMLDNDSPNGVKYVHANSNLIGFLNGDANWIAYWDNAGNHNSNGSITAGSTIRGNAWLISSNNAGAYSYITMTDDESPSWVKYIHADSNVMWFLSPSSGWMSYWDNAWNQYNAGVVNASDIYIRSLGKYVSQLWGWICVGWVQHNHGDGRGEAFQIFKSTYNESGTYAAWYRWIWPPEWAATVVTCTQL